MIVIRYNGRLGNKLIQYSFGRILADKYSCPLYCKPIDSFPEVIPISGKQEEKGHFGLHLLTGHIVDLDEVEEALEKGLIILLAGFFQRTEYYTAHKSQMRRWCSPVHCTTIERPYAAVHVRLGDIGVTDLHEVPINGHHACPLSYFLHCIREIQALNLPIVLVTETPESPLVARLLAEIKDIRVVSSTPKNDFELLLHADVLVMSQGTFSWLPAFLGRAFLVYFPLIGYWHPLSLRKDIRLHINEERFKYVDCRDLTTLSYSELDSTWPSGQAEN